ncbi:MAG: S41 family peptidase [Bacteroidota bacterium]
MYLFRWLFGLLWLGGILPVSPILAQPTPCQQALMLQKTIDKHHYAPRPMGEELNGIIVAQFLESLDPMKVLFTQAQTQALQDACSQLSEQIRQRDCQGLTLATQLYTEQLNWLDRLLSDWEENPWSLAEGGEPADHQSYARSLTELESRWRDYLDQNIQSQLTDSTQGRGESTWATLLQEMIQAERCQVSLELNHPEGLEQIVGKRLLAAIASAQDPHTMYLSFNQKERFEYQLSEEAATFGFELVQNPQGEIEIATLVPGGAAWNSQALNEGDVLLSIQVAGRSTIEFDCQAMLEAFRVLGSPSVLEADFAVRKVSGEHRSVRLRKRKLSLTDQGIRSVILAGETKLGYLYLPSFYIDDSQGSSGRKGASDQLAMELIRLKRQGIEGLILDLRGNGGGSMWEAMRIAGLFIDVGAVAMTDDRLEGAELLKDMSRGMAFRKPLLVLQDRSSASASELFTACIQDYQRGLVVGDTSFGKASIQQILPIDAYQSNQLSYDQLNLYAPAFVKLTTGKFYRVTGESHQAQGVIPDIALPFSYPIGELGEQYYPQALANTRLEKESYYRPQAALPIAALARSSQLRRVNGTIESVETSVFRSQSPTYLQQSAVGSLAETSWTIQLHQQLEQDMYLQEAFRILSDWLSISKP